MFAPLVIDGPMSSLVFESYITNTLTKEVRPGDLLIRVNSCNPGQPCQVQGRSGPSVCKPQPCVGDRLQVVGIRLS